LDLRTSLDLIEFKNWWGFEKASDDFAPPETFPKSSGFSGPTITTPFNL
jgi:hypothetical protein